MLLGAIVGAPGVIVLLVSAPARQLLQHQPWLSCWPDSRNIKLNKRMEKKNACRCTLRGSHAVCSTASSRLPVHPALLAGFAAFDTDLHHVTRELRYDGNDCKLLAASADAPMYNTPYTTRVFVQCSVRAHP